MPFLIKWPGVTKAGQRTRALAQNIDFAPTFLEVGGVAVPESMEGQSLVPILENRDARGRQAWLLEYWKYFPENFPSYVGVRSDTHKYIEYEKTLEPELFDLRADPGESHNLTGTPAGEKILPELKGMLEALKRGERM